MKQQDRWGDVLEKGIRDLREQRKKVGENATRYKAEAERRMQAFKDVHDAMKVELQQLEAALEAHRARVSASVSPQPDNVRALPAPRAGQMVPRTGEKADVRELIKTWAREHDGQLVVAAFVDALIESGRFSHKPSAQTAVGVALNSIRTGYEKMSRGVYRFYAIDGQALRVDAEDVSA